MKSKTPSQDWKDRANDMSREEVVDTLTTDEATGPWQVISSLLILALQDDIIGESQLMQGVSSAMMSLAMEDPSGFDDLVAELEAIE